MVSGIFAIETDPQRALPLQPSIAAVQRLLPVMPPQ
jgi:hypothetical protein